MVIVLKYSCEELRDESYNSEDPTASTSKIFLLFTTIISFVSSNYVFRGIIKRDKTIVKFIIRHLISMVNKSNRVNRF